MERHGASTPAIMPGGPQPTSQDHRILKTSRQRRRPSADTRDCARWSSSATRSPTDHISPSGSITAGSAAGDYLESHGVPKSDFNAYGTRRGCSDVVLRSTFANIRLQNEMVSREGSWTKIMPEGNDVPVFSAIETYLREDNT